MRRLSSACGFALLALSCAPFAQATDYLIRVPANVDLTPPPPVTPPAPAISVELADQPLPEGEVGKPYSFDFSTLLSISGSDEGYNLNDVAWSLGGGTLPEGLALNASGTLGGTPASAHQGHIDVGARYAGKEALKRYGLKISKKTSCDLPWGGTLNQGQNVLAYTAATATWPNFCSSTASFRSCENGVLSGQGEFNQCADSIPPSAVTNAALNLHKLAKGGAIIKTPPFTMSGWVNIGATGQGPVFTLSRYYSHSSIGAIESAIVVRNSSGTRYLSWVKSYDVSSSSLYGSGENIRAINPGEWFYLTAEVDKDYLLKVAINGVFLYQKKLYAIEPYSEAGSQGVAGTWGTIGYGTPNSFAFNLSGEIRNMYVWPQMIYNGANFTPPPRQ